VRIVAAIKNPSFIRSILDHLEKIGALPNGYRRSAARALPKAAAEAAGAAVSPGISLN